MVLVLLVGIGLLTAIALSVAGAPYSFLYRNVIGFSVLRGLSQAAIGLGVLTWLGAVALLAGWMALQPAPWPWKVLLILPAYVLFLLLLGLLMFLLGVGTVGPFAVLWTAASALLTLAGAVIAAATQEIKGRIRVITHGLLGVSSVGMLTAGLALLSAFILTMAVRPTAIRSVPAPEGLGRLPPPPEAPRDFPEAIGGPQAFFPGEPRGGAQPLPPRPEGRLFPLRFPPSISTMALGGGIVTALGVLAGFLWLRSRRSLRAATVDQGLTLPLEWRREGLQALAGSAGLTVALLLAAQLVPAPRTNPPARVVVQWDSPQAQALWQRACADCHTNETRWPWYTAIAPASWLMISHVNEGRQALNLSELDLSQLSTARKARLMEEIARAIRAGTMPPPDYLLIHPEARLSALEKELLIQGLQEVLSR